MDGGNAKIVHRPLDVHLTCVMRSPVKLLQARIYKVDLASGYGLLDGAHLRPYQLVRLIGTFLVLPIGLLSHAGEIVAFWCLKAVLLIHRADHVLNARVLVLVLQARLLMLIFWSFVFLAPWLIDAVPVVVAFV